MHSNVMHRLRVQAFQDQLLCSSTNNAQGFVHPFLYYVKKLSNVEIEIEMLKYVSKYLHMI